ncbi:MAG TPA: hypothetical protein VKU94_02695 [Geobacterales bacterium]|nr:hypothetical protein [Geobacterales bacterium]
MSFSKKNWLFLFLIVALINSVFNAITPLSYAQNKGELVIFHVPSNIVSSDLWGAIVSISIFQNTSATITVHPTYGTNYYSDVLLITNLDAITHYIAFNITDPLAMNVFSSAELYLRNPANGELVAKIDIGSTGFRPSNNIANWISLGSNSSLMVDLVISIKASSNTQKFFFENLTLYLVYM